MGYRSAVTADTPLVWYHLDEASGTTFADSSGNSRPATGSGTFSYGVSGGVTGNDALDLTTAKFSEVGAYGNNDDVFTIEFWLKLTATTRQRIGSLGILSIDHTSSGLVLILDNLGTVTIPHPITGLGFNDNLWHHFVIVYEGSGNFIVYSDGGNAFNFGSATTNFLAASGSTTFQMGDRVAGNPTGSVLLTGQLDEVAVYDHILTSGRVAAHWDGRIGMDTVELELTASGFVYDPDEYFDYQLNVIDTALYWRLADPGGAIALDSGYYGLDGTITGSVNYAQPGATGDGDDAMRFTGGNVAINVEAGNIAPGEGWGWALALALHTSQLSDMCLAEIGPIRIELQAGYVWLRTPGMTHGFVTTAINDGQWHHLVILADGFGPSYELWLDGVLQDVVVLDVDLPSSGFYDVRLGDHASPETGFVPFNGTVDEFALMYYEIEASDVIYLNGQLQPPVLGGGIVEHVLNFSADGYCVDLSVFDPFEHWWAGDPVSRLRGVNDGFQSWLGGQPVFMLEDLQGVGQTLELTADGYVPLDLLADGYCVESHQLDLTGDGYCVVPYADLQADGFVVDPATVLLRAYPRRAASRSYPLPAGRLFPVEP